MNNMTCARCNSEVSSGDGYAVYSDASEGIAADHRVFVTSPGPDGVEKGDRERKQIDAMLYCEQCADILFTARVWKNARSLRVDMPPEDVNSVDGKQARCEVIDFSIALHAKRRGLSPSDARREAHALGRMWWKDQDAAKLQLVAEGSDPNAFTETRWTKVRLMDENIALYGSEDGAGPVLDYLNDRPVVDLAPSASPGCLLRVELTDGRRRFVSRNVRCFKVPLWTTAQRWTPIHAAATASSPVIASLDSGKDLEQFGELTTTDGLAWVPVLLASGQRGYMNANTKVIDHGIQVRVQKTGNDRGRRFTLKDGTLRELPAEGRKSGRVITWAMGLGAVTMIILFFNEFSSPQDGAVVHGLLGAKLAGAGALLGGSVALFIILVRDQATNDKVFGRTRRVIWWRVFIGALLLYIASSALIALITSSTTAFAAYVALLFCGAPGAFLLITGLSRIWRHPKHLV